jgi:predicted nucleic acid-binding protein
MTRPGRPPGASRHAYVDAHVLIAFLAGAAHPLHDASRALLARMDRGELRLIVSPIVVAEVVWAARSALGRSRGQAAALLLEVLESDGFEVTERTVLRHALQLQADHPRLDFADAWLAARAVIVGPPTVASFDGDLDTIEGVARIA